MQLQLGNSNGLSTSLIGTDHSLVGTLTGVTLHWGQSPSPVTACGSVGTVDLQWVYLSPRCFVRVYLETVGYIHTTIMDYWSCLPLSLGGLSSHSRCIFLLVTWRFQPHPRTPPRGARPVRKTPGRVPRIVHPGLPHRHKSQTQSGTSHYNHGSTDSRHGQTSDGRGTRRSEGRVRRHGSGRNLPPLGLTVVLAPHPRQQTWRHEETMRRLHQAERGVTTGSVPSSPHARPQRPR